MNAFQKKFTLILTAAVTGFATVEYIIFLFRNGAEQGIQWEVVLLFFLINFIITFSIVAFLNTHFLFERLSQIFESISSQQNKGNSTNDLPPDNDVIEAIREGINKWVEDKKSETDRLKKLELYRKEYIGNVSHELKTPVFNIQGYIFTLLDGGLDDKSVNRNYLERAAKSVDRMINTIEDLESISQLETGELSIEPERFDIVEVVKDIFDTQEMKAAAQGIIFSLKKDEPVYVFADRFRIQQVLTNLLVNSVKYGKEYGETTVKISEANGMVKIEVADNGIGISPEHLPRLFERFYRIDKSRSRDQGGTGLGLSIVKHILEAHDQTIQVTSTPGEGSLFSFVLKKG
jgi:two-component system, OmpR family, phosphate regulon sensor histidine kinase PhoR